ncbi:carbon-nitrogen hydrolase family protein [Mycolicibacillus parakoreensis]|uniref:Carbon-nitrogen hydrolase family protein n=1 Tax=Mycolicibacillus parakoreensis TaxID=1069221 RepID=A0ABY3TWD2_9MYCO|nr:carbon-nitrogen hydrolase family protein [Mycolicibacillus parakoreensis]ULN51199.1 carbon-nitrogen hydrolase family protein [Mycolicibacillus parakoreensis]
MSATATTTVAAVQQQAVLADVTANLAMAEQQVGAAADAGAALIVLPEFFTTGMAFDPALATAALPADGPATALLTTLARRRRVTVGGSFLCRADDGQTYNRFVLAGPDGVIGHHDKDLPTMWENYVYRGGVDPDDDGVLPAVDGVTVGAALCWEFIRTQTVRRMAGRVDVVVGGSCWWSVPAWPPRRITAGWEAANAATAGAAAPVFARLVGAPVIHAAHSGPLRCRLPGTPLPYRGHLEGGAVVAAADGTVLARRGPDRGPGFALATITVARVPPPRRAPRGFWLHHRGPLPALAWAYQNRLGARWYRRHHPSTVGNANAESTARAQNTTAK